MANDVHRANGQFGNKYGSDQPSRLPEHMGVSMEEAENHIDSLTSQLSHKTTLLHNGEMRWSTPDGWVTLEDFEDTCAGLDYQRYQLWLNDSDLRNDIADHWNDEAWLKTQLDELDNDDELHQTDYFADEGAFRRYKANQSFDVDGQSFGREQIAEAVGWYKGDYDQLISTLVDRTGRSADIMYKTTDGRTTKVNLTFGQLVAGSSPDPDAIFEQYQDETVRLFLENTHYRTFDREKALQHVMDDLEWDYPLSEALQYQCHRSNEAEKYFRDNNLTPDMVEEAREYGDWDPSSHKMFRLMDGALIGVPAERNARELAWEHRKEILSDIRHARPETVEQVRSTIDQLNSVNTDKE